MNAVALLYEWFQENKEVFISLGEELEFKDSGRGSAYVRLESKSSLMELCAWDHATCLDIQIIDIATEESSYPHTGSCQSLNEFEAHLKKFMSWFENEATKNT